jgi:hypothetical protein
VVLPGAETELQPLSFELPADLTIQVVPPLDPYQQRWAVELLRQGKAPDTFDVIRQGQVTPEGVYVAARLEPGPYRVRVRGSAGSHWGEEPVELAPEGTTKEVRLPLVEVEGTVRWKDEPKAALLWFGGKFGVTRIQAKSSTLGRFKTTLPETGKPWRIEVENPLEHFYATFPEVDVRKAPGQDKARIDLELVDTWIRGEVVDEEGKPAPGAEIWAFGGSSSVDSRASAEDGRFELKALPPGAWELQASRDGDPRLESEGALVELAEGKEAEVRLVLRSLRKFSGMVVGPSGQPVPGAHVVGSLDQEDHYLSGATPEAYTDAAGVFELRLPGRTAGLYLTVFPPGFAVRQVRVDVRETSTLPIPVGPLGGTVVLDYGSGREATQESPWWRASLFADRQIAVMDILRQWAELHGHGWGQGRKLAIPMLPPGRYTACLDLGPQVATMGVAPAANDPRCVSGELSPLGTLDLRLPGTSAPEPAAGGSR